MRNWLGLLLLLVMICVACLTARTQPTPAPQARSTAPEYDEKGDLKRPTDFRTWVFVGANIGLRYHKELPDTKPREKDLPKNDTPGEFHNVYIRPESYEHYLKTGKFPDLTVLVMDVYESKDRDTKGIVSKGLFPGAHRRLRGGGEERQAPGRVEDGLGVLRLRQADQGDGIGLSRRGLLRLPPQARRRG